MSEANLDRGRDQISKALRAAWWLMLLRGVLLIILGLYALFNPGMTLVLLTQVIGFYMMLEGCLALWVGITGQTPSRMWTIVRGVLLVLAGLFFVAFPLIVAVVNATMFVYLIAIAIIASGIFEIYAAIRDRRQIQGEGWLMLSGAVAILFGVVLAAAPLTAAQIIVRVIGVFAIIAGVAIIVGAFQIRTFVNRLTG
jgi:uncharacterized membrane protein HdeD (DUF308 family)